MNGTAQAAALAVICALLALTLKKESAVFGYVLALAGVCLLLWRGCAGLGTAVSGLRDLLAQSGLGREVYGPVLQVAAIGVVVRIGAALCKDAGQGALAAQLELIGTAAATAACLPLFRQVLALTQNFI